MAQDSKRGLFASVFGSKKKTEEELEAERETHERIESRIREVLAVIDPPNLEPALHLECDVPHVELKPVTASSSIPSATVEEPDYSFLHPATEPERKLPSRYRPAFDTLAPARVAQAR